MRLYTAGFRSTNAGTSARPVGSIFGIASRSGFLREVGIWNTTAVACTFALRRCTAAGTPGTGITEGLYETGDDTNDLTVFNSHSADATVATAELRRVALGAQIGSGAIFTFAGRGIFIPAGTANGIGWIPDGTGQVVDLYFEWME